ncbi:hypothetical protein, variant [Phialophora macrospora]|nr:hypothetical protein, variant [Phialophora macrospora]
MLLLPGIPGAGKTFIASIIIGDLQRRVSQDGNVALTFFYNSFKRSAAQSRFGIVSSFARQLYLQRPRSIEVVTGLYKKHQGHAPATQPRLEEISLALENLLLGFKIVYVVIDALDEGQGPAESDDRPWRYVLSLLCQMVKKLGSEVAIKIIATSRPNLEPEIDGLFDTEARLTIQAHDEDVGMFCDALIGNIRCVAQKPELRLKVKDAICESANGMFLLAKLHCDTLAAKTKPRDVLQAAKSFKLGGDALHRAYEDTMRRIECQPTELSELARKVLVCVAYSARPLSLDELRHALAVDEDTYELDPELDLDHPQDMMSSCAGLVVVDSESNIVRLVHYTTQSFLDSYSDNLMRDRHGFLAATCLNYLHLDAFATHVSDTADYPFLRYSAQHWNWHLSLASSPTHLRQRAFAFLDHVGRVTTALPPFEWMAYQRHGACALHFLAYRGLDDWIIDYIRRGQPSEGNIRQEPLCTECGMSVAQNEERWKDDSTSWGKALTSFRDSLGRTPLWYATRARQDSTAKLLLDINEELLNDEDNTRQSLLAYALECGAEAIALRILEKPIMIPWRDYRDKYGQTYLHLAINSGSQAVVARLPELILASELIDPISPIGSFTTTQDSIGETAFFFSAKGDSVNITKKMLDYSKGLELNIPDKLGMSPLSKAASYGMSEVVKLLLDQENIQTALRDRKGRTALHWAAMNGSVATISCLIDSGEFPVDSTDTQGRTSLPSAAEHGKVDVMLHHLSRKDVDVQSVDDDGANALMYASSYGRTRCVAVLAPLTHNINATDVHGCTALHKLASLIYYSKHPSNYASCLETLINQGASLDAKNNANESAYDICRRRLETPNELGRAFEWYHKNNIEVLGVLVSIMKRHMPTAAPREGQEALNDPV